MKGLHPLWYQCWFTWSLASSIQVTRIIRFSRRCSHRTSDRVSNLMNAIFSQGWLCFLYGACMQRSTLIELTSTMGRNCTLLVST
ncbi:hypothetical protein BJY52DRAFT_1298458 [Lactarius psammicola]|nr:hypothetical protein BJY52DRAFT_1298458 [Lactarius psammicola]